MAGRFICRITLSIASGILSSMAYSIPSDEEIAAMTQTEYKIYENRIRRTAERQGLRLEKSRRRDPRAVDYGTYMLVDPATTAVMASGLASGYGLSLTDVDRELSKGLIGYEAFADFTDYDNEAEARGEL